MAKQNKGKEITKNPGGAPPDIIIQQLTVRKWNRTEQDVTKWRSATRSAESVNPRRTLLYDLYADVALDAHVEAVTSKRRDAVTLANWQFVDKNKEPVDEINQMLDTDGFGMILEEIINSKFWGYTMMQPKFWKTADDKWEVAAGLLPRLHYRPEDGILTYQKGGTDGLDVRSGIYAKKIMEVGAVDDLGLFLKAGLYYVLKRGGLGDWAGLIQTWGQALIDAVWDGVDDNQRTRLEQTLNGVGQGGNIVRPSGTELTVHQPPSQNTGTAHADFMKYLNNELSKALLGTTETTESSGSSGYAQSKTHSEEDDNKHMSDVQFTRRILNSRFIKILNTHGFDTKGGEFIVQGEETELTKGESFEIHKSMVTELKVPVSDEFWYDTYGVPKPDDYDKIKEALEENTEVDPLKEPVQKKEPSGGDNNKGTGTEEAVEPGKKKEKEAEVKLSFWQGFRDFFSTAPAVTTGAVTQSCGNHPTIKLADSELAYPALLERIYAAKGNAVWDAELYSHTMDVLGKGFKKGWYKNGPILLATGLGFEYGKNDPGLLTAFEQNLFQFSGAKTLAQIQALNQIFKESSSFEEFYQLASEQLDVFNRDWLETEYNTAVLTGEAAATYRRLISQVDIFPYWEYKTVGDHLVRPSHVLLDGLILPANDPRWKKLYPPNGWRCRCYVVPRMRHEFDAAKLTEMRKLADAYLNSPAGQSEIAQGWGVNRAEAGQVFTTNQFYVRKFRGKASKELNNLKFHDYGLESYSQARKVATKEVPIFKGAAHDFYKDLKEAQGVKVLTDYQNRPLEVNERNFTEHTTNVRKKREGRAANLLAMRATIQQPDEVWLSGKKLEQLVYVKYYKGKTMISIGKITNTGVELKTWFELTEKKAVIANYRRGLLVYKK